MLDILFQILINPIYILIEIIYNFLFKFCSLNQTVSIIFLSVIVNFLWLPLYLKADKLKIENDEIQEKLKKRADVIKKNFKGEERHMLLAAYYRENNYHPLYALRGILSLVLQMVFFVAAYLFFIRNLPSSPDGLLKIAEIKINVLPFLMTFINIAAGLLYIKEHNIKKIQIWILSLFFLIVLYNAPYTLVLYWTFNNLFSFVKNLILIKKIKISFKKPLILNKFIDFIKKQNTDKTDLRTCYFLTCVCLWVFVGLLIPWNLLSSAPPKFFNIYPYESPFPILFYNTIKAGGIFIFWGWVLYSFCSKKQRNKLASFLIVLFYFFVLNYCLIEYPYGEVTNTLEFTTYIGSRVLSCSYYFILLFVILICCVLLLKKRDLIKKTLIIFLAASFLILIYDTREIILLGKKVPSQSDKFEPVYHFSKNNKNVLILFIDKAIGSYLPLIFKEEPSLKKYFEGFTYYPNIVSFACYTRLAYPALMGGYEYSPLNMDLDLNKSLKEKYNESILMLPKIFKDNGFKTTITDAPWGDFQYITPKELFLNEGINYDNILGKYSDLYKKIYSFSNDKSSLRDLERNMLYFSFMKIMPVSLRDFIIDNNNYLNLKKEEIKYTNDLLASYSSLYFLDKITKFDAKESVFMIINNELTHNADCFLTYPDYKLTFKPVVKTPYDFDRYSAIHYHSNAASIRLIARYLDFLKQNGIYDNTRIIIVSDHGAKNLKNPYLNKKIEDNIARFNALLLVKDFNQKGEMKISDEFMTNADVPYIALKNIIKNPKNPYTNNPVIIDKTPPLVLINKTKRFNLKEKGNTPFDNKTDCITVKDNIFKVDSWKKLKKSKVNEIRKMKKRNYENKNI